MNAFVESLQTAFGLIVQADAPLLRVVGLSLGVSGTACVLAAGLGVAAGAALAVSRFRGRRAVLVMLNTLLALPSVVVGLVVYLLLSRSGPLGHWGLLFTPGAMVIAQTVLVVPIVAALTREVIAGPWKQHGEQLRSLGAGRALGGALLLWDERLALLTVLLTAFGRAISEVGAVMIVGGNIDGHTRVMTTAIAHDTSKWYLPLALALGIVLLSVVLGLNVLIALVRAWATRRHGGSGGSSGAPGAAASTGIAGAAHG